MVNNTYKTAKINFINSEAVNIILRHSCYIHAFELMKLIVAVLYVLFCIGLWAFHVVIKRKFFLQL